VSSPESTAASQIHRAFDGGDMRAGESECRSWAPAARPAIDRERLLREQLLPVAKRVGLERHQELGCILDRFLDRASLHDRRSFADTAAALLLGR
jgi:hypothetical protein